MSEPLSHPLVTTILVTYQRPKLLKKAIHSALSQTYPHIQVSVYDDASGDETESIVAKIMKEDSRVKYFRHPVNVGAIKNYMYAIEHIDTPYFSLLDDDDMLLERFYETALKGFEMYPKAMFSATGVILMDREKNSILGIPTGKWKAGFYEPPDGLFAMLKNGHTIWTGTLYRREVIDEFNCFEIGGSDMHLTLRLSALYAFVFTETPGAVFYQSHHLLNLPLESNVSRWFCCIQNLKEDNKLTLPVRNAIADWFMKQVRNYVLRVALVSSLKNSEFQFQKASEILRKEFNLFNVVRVLSFVKWLCKHLPLIPYSLKMVYGIRKYITERTNRKIYTSLEILQK